ncbi:MAG: hypothetical protein ACI9FJ_002647, partial [Alteromonadaceae bacterium]
MIEAKAKSEFYVTMPVASETTAEAYNTNYINSLSYFGIFSKSPG